MFYRPMCTPNSVQENELDIVGRTLVVVVYFVVVYFPNCTCDMLC